MKLGFRTISFHGLSQNNRAENKVNIKSTEQQHTEHAKATFAHYQANSNIHFGTLRKMSSTTLKPSDTSFFRDTKTLETILEQFQETFPDGAHIINHACSNGEEALTLSMLLKNNPKYPIMALDFDAENIELAKKGVHSVFTGEPEGFLFKDDKDLTKKELEHKKAFFELFEETVAPSEPLNNTIEYNILKNASPDFQEKYFKLKDKYQDTISYRQGDFTKLGELDPNQKAGLITFRNAFYHITGDSYDLHTAGIIRKVIAAGSDDLSDDIDDSSLSEEILDRNKIAQNLVGQIYDKLEPNGLFVLGDNFNEHAFYANKFDPQENLVDLEDTPFFPIVDDIKTSISTMSTMMPDFDKKAAFEELEKTMGNLKMLKKSPIELAFEQDGRFEPVVFADVDFQSFKIKAPVAYKKIA